MRTKNNIFKTLVYIFAFLSIALLMILIGFMFKESLPFFKQYSVNKFLFGNLWDSMDGSFGAFNIILASFCIALLACAFSFPISYGLSLMIVFYTNNKVKTLVSWIIRILAGIPSIIYGFFGLFVIVKFFEKNFKMAAGESVFAGSVILSIMILPYFVEVLTETFEKIKQKYQRQSDCFGISKEYFIRKIVLKQSLKSAFSSFVLAFSRAIGETMAVMMVIGNAPIFPKFFSKAETIASLIALEVGMSEAGSLHYHALYASSFVLLVFVIILDIILFVTKKRTNNYDEV
ncbi:phosphate ABC transporter permease subunit PstC [Finegoldia magna]|uniref:phosphate ABC transporter permease subunit PstC n=1 Tax=Finegoldia magna TaxID=1260 RepID=UPI000D71DA80|nr:phosphate ABC transporter permease subunit PstC [Finegoldia magna]MCC3309994.1 phosphate ABC transporter permease subunit PstC [Finegoldia magna]MDU1010564.1 phosphate ABC transporter permease subunit PstC [Finegoldia magna]MDU1086721.1 phosphate ABC transporter permease subunit PstC [Finegoldia magna]MDU5200351.1 phosphate ABC transporter permease subunit PstC [Finegoldia magna]MDU6775495.1 phosphate ABC transporter permease subunit PstC [Finegoldia magna]